MRKPCTRMLTFSKPLELTKPLLDWKSNFPVNWCPSRFWRKPWVNLRPGLQNEAWHTTIRYGDLTRVFYGSLLFCVCRSHRSWKLHPGLQHMLVSLLVFLASDWRAFCSGDMYRWHRDFYPACFGVMSLLLLMLSNSSWSKLRARSQPFASMYKSMHPRFCFCPFYNYLSERWSNFCSSSKFGRMPSRWKKCG